MIALPNRLNWENLRAWSKESDRKTCPRCSGVGKIAAMRTCPTCLGDATLRRDVRPMISEAKLVRVGSLLRIRDDYEPVWHMAQGEDGKSYIFRAGTGDGEDQRIYVAQDGPTELEAPAKNTVLTQREAAVAFGAWAGDRMRQVGVTRAHVGLLRRWAEERVWWDVFLNGKEIDNVQTGSNEDAASVKKSLVEHDGYDPGIVVRRSKKRNKGASITKTAEPSIPGVGGIGNASSALSGSGSAAPTAAGPNQTIDQVHGWECPECGEIQPGGREFQDHLRDEHGIVDGD
jgi:hypothetical protein